MRRELENIQMENSVYEQYYEKKTAESEKEEPKSRAGSRQGGKSASKKSAPFKLNPHQKYEIANQVNDDVLKEIEDKKKNSERVVETLRAVLEETEIRIGELKRDAYEFKRDVVVGAENPRTGKIMSEKVTKYVDDRQAQRDVVIDKLRLKNTTLKAAIGKLEQQLSQKEEVGDALHYIDFHQLQIENKQFVAKIEERNDELLLVKLSTGKTIKCLNELKSKLNECLGEMDYMKKEVDEKNDQKRSLEKESKDIQKEIRTEKKLQGRLRQAIEDAAAMPNIEDYIKQKKTMYECESELLNWQKKIDIGEMTATNTRRRLMESGGKFTKSISNFN